jgi:hypothetical protein
METIKKTCPNCKETWILRHNHKDLGGVLTRLSFIADVQLHYQACSYQAVENFAKQQGIKYEN